MAARAGHRVRNRGGALRAARPSARRLLSLLVLALALGACGGKRAQRASPRPAAQSASTASAHHDDVSRAQSERYRHARDGAPAGPAPDVSKLPEPVPKVEPRARYGNKPSYSVLGKTYRVLPDSSGYAERGVASWYGTKFHGYLTSSFEPYDMYAFSAAHKTLPLPSYARVTNLDNGKSVVVRVNDRGPFHDGRLIDLSYAAAVRIGVWPKGTARVEVRAIDPRAPSAAAPASRAGPTAGQVFLQLGAFGERGNAQAARSRARRAGLQPVMIEAVTVEGQRLYRVRVGPLRDVAAAEALRERVARLGFDATRVAVEPQAR